MQDFSVIIIFFSATTGKGILIEENSNDTFDGTEQIGSGDASTSNIELKTNENALIDRIVSLVTQKIEPRLSGTLWNNHNLNNPNTSVIQTPKLDGPIHYNNTITKNDENDKYGLK